MNQSDENPTTAPDPIAEVSEAEAKPVRRRRTTKAEAPVTEAEAPVADVPDADPALKAAPKPARRRKAPVKEAEVESGAESVEAAPVAEIPAAPAEAVVEAAPRAPRAPRSRAKPAAAVAEASDTEASLAAAPSQVDVEVPAAAVATTTPVASSEQAPQGTGAEGVSVEGEGEGAGAQVDSPRSSRNRRRGRKDRVRGEGAEMNEGGNAVPRTGERQVPAPVVAEAGAVFAQVLSGDFDVEDAAPDAASEAEVEPDAEIGGEEVPGAPKRVLQADPEAPKLHKVLAQAGVGSRRDMEELILDGQITVNGEPAHIGQRISFGDRIQVKGKPVRVRIVPPPPRIIAYHKPVGEVVTHDDPEHRPTVFRRLPRLQQGKWQSVGRLDLNTEGLLLFTNSGELANQLMHPRFGVEREYAVRVLGTLERDAKARLLEGVMVEGQTASFKSIEDGGGEGANHWYRVVITEGRNREVRKLFDTVGLTVSRLIRIRYGSVVLPRGLKRGVWVDLDEADVRIIRQLTGLGEGRRDRQEGRGNNERGNNNRNDRGGRQGAPSQPNERGNNNNFNNAHRGQDRNNERGDRGPRGKRGQGAGQGGQNAQNFVPAQSRERTQDEIDRDEDLDFDPSKIPNPLEQTFDKRFVQKPRGPAGGAGFGRGGGGFGAGGSAPPRGQGGQKKGGGPREPDPLQTSMGYLGADAFHGRGKGGGGGNRGGGNRSGGGGFGGGGGGGGGFGGGGGRRGR